MGTYLLERQIVCSAVQCFEHRYLFSTRDIILIVVFMTLPVGKVGSCAELACFATYR